MVSAAGVEDAGAAIAVMEIKGCRTEAVLDLVSACRHGVNEGLRKKKNDEEK